MDDALSVLGTAWPILMGLAAITYALIKLHVDMENIKEKERVLFELWNSKEK